HSPSLLPDYLSPLPRRSSDLQQQSGSPQNQDAIASPPPVSGGLQPSLSQAGSSNSPALSPATGSQHGGSNQGQQQQLPAPTASADRKSTRLNSSHGSISYAVF